MAVMSMVRYKSQHTVNRFPYFTPETTPSAGWHWEEKNQMGWSRQKLEELLVGMLADLSAVQGNAKVTVLKELKGEV